jgi:hypothetical protein
LQQEFKIFIFALATVKNTVADIDTKATAKNCFDEENLSETECRQEREVVNTGSLYHFERRNCTMSRSQIFENEFLEGAENQVAGQMGRLGHDNREESGCARSREVWWPKRKK